MKSLKKNFLVVVLVLAIVFGSIAAYVLSKNNNIIDNKNNISSVALSLDAKRDDSLLPIYVYDSSDKYGLPAHPEDYELYDINSNYVEYYVDLSKIDSNGLYPIDNFPSLVCALTDKAARGNLKGYKLMRDFYFNLNQNASLFWYRLILNHDIDGEQNAFKKTFDGNYHKVQFNRVDIFVMSKTSDEGGEYFELKPGDSSTSLDYLKNIGTFFQYIGGNAEVKNLHFVLCDDVNFRGRFSNTYSGQKFGFFAAGSSGNLYNNIFDISGKITYLNSNKGDEDFIGHLSGELNRGEFSHNRVHFRKPQLEMEYPFLDARKKPYSHSGALTSYVKKDVLFYNNLFSSEEREYLPKLTVDMKGKAWLQYGFLGVIDQEISSTNYLFSLTNDYLDMQDSDRNQTIFETRYGSTYDEVHGYDKDEPKEVFITPFKSTKAKTFYVQKSEMSNKFGFLADEQYKYNTDFFLQRNTGNDHDTYFKLKFINGIKYDSYTSYDNNGAKVGRETLFDSDTDLITSVSDNRGGTYKLNADTQIYTGANVLLFSDIDVNLNNIKKIQKYMMVQIKQILALMKIQ